MNVLYILGNGFDKAMGMKTSYPEFYQYLMADKKEEWPDDTIDRLYFITNSSAFTI
jgi:hypothetical protein